MGNFTASLTEQTSGPSVRLPTAHNRKDFLPFRDKATSAAFSRILRSFICPLKSAVLELNQPNCNAYKTSEANRANGGQCSYLKKITDFATSEINKLGAKKCPHRRGTVGCLLTGGANTTSSRTALRRPRRSRSLEVL